jgi:hypothetical protein
VWLHQIALRRLEIDLRAIVQREPHELSHGQPPSPDVTPSPSPSNELDQRRQQDARTADGSAW